MIEIIDAIKSLKPNASWVLTGTSYSGLDWKDESQTKPTEEEVEAEVKRLQAEYDSKDYQRKRASEYPSVVDQLDLIYHSGIDAWKAKIKETKDKYPKP
tara:strand:- start:6 stop:302 length:297 start_codon:yes stop_codon:yes gene_type:complete